MFSFFGALLFVCTAGAQTPWWLQVHQLDSATPKERQEILQTLRSDPKFPDQLRAALSDDIHAKEALKAISEGGMQALWPDVLSAAESDVGWQAILTLAKLNREQAHAEWKPWLKKFIGSATWTGIQSPEKLAVVEMARTEQVLLPDAELQSLLRDKSSAVRITTVDLLFMAFRSSPHDSKLEKMVGETLKASPYQVRQRAYTLVAAEPLATHREFRKQIKGCMGSETYRQVRSICEDLQKSL